MLTTKVCSSSGSELPGCASWIAGALRKLTDGKLPAWTAATKSLVSYWWLAPPSAEVPIDAIESGRVWLRFRVEG